MDPPDKPGDDEPRFERSRLWVHKRCALSGMTAVEEDPQIRFGEPTCMARSFHALRQRARSVAARSG